ncbi:uncharacterized protein LOC120359655 isoform X2 [Solenopsis invicta]|uniref:uncharacterized protein LOC120359021 isoform X2 n=1 Tax=Solenopsis invicta TaxID=13686 RepID=UPI00193D03E4|nr:uncharacterized protein LOC120359021 isoform X2 [Solenopsis invicta]XP_039313837.1 uncharacterized protein LOC120359655 isoform X2 [Solenopsis invicta]
MERRSLVTDKGDTSITLHFDSIRRTELHNVITSTESKTCKQRFDKRRRYGPYGSLPYGHCNL